MKIKLLVKLVEKLLGMADTGDEPRADMYLPDMLLAMALVMLAGGTACGVYCIVQFALWAVVCAAVFLVLGVAAVMCWRNQTIRMISSSQFVYTTFLGNSYTMAFADITGLRQNSDSMTLYVRDKKIHIEAMAIISPRLAEAINSRLQ